jgi:nucleoside-diphosphate-sugar epimerase
MEVMITGGNGFLGRHLVSALLERRVSVRVLALPGEDTGWLEERDVRVFRGDIVSPHTLIAAMDGVHGVFHLASMIGVWRSLEDYSAVNVSGTANVCRAALNAGVARLVHISSAMVYDMAIGRPATEDDAPAPLDEPYCLTKAQGDVLVQRMIRDEHLPAVIIRPGTLIGPGDRLNFSRMADRIRSRKGVIIGRGNNAVPLLSVADMVHGLLLAFDQAQARPGAYNIGNDQPLTQAEYLSLIADELGVPAPRIHVPYSVLYTAAHMAERLAKLSKDRTAPFLTRHGVKLYGANNLLSIDKARRELGYVPAVSVSDAVRSACRWYLRDGRQVPATPPPASVSAAGAL